MLQRIDWIEIPAGRYRIGLDRDEAEAIWKDAYERADMSMFGRYSELPEFLSAATPAMVVEVSAYSIERVARDTRGIRYADAHAFARNLGFSLPTETEWEIAERYGPMPISETSLDEWCLDLFNSNRADLNGLRNPVVNLQRNTVVWGAPRRRHAIRGGGLDGIYHPSMRFHGGPGNDAFARTTFRMVKRTHRLRGVVG